MPDSLSISVADGVAVVTLTRPELFNRIGQDMHRELPAALTELAGRSDVRAAVLAAEGRVFSAGGDVELMRQAHADPVVCARIVDEGRALIAALTDIAFPIVAAVQGAAIGLGANIALCCDAVVAARGVKIADPHVVMGLVAGDGGCLVWPAAVGMLRARRHLLTGDPVLAEDAYAMGLVTDLVDAPEHVGPAAHALALRMAALPPLAVQGTKRALNAVSRHRADEVVDLAFAYEARAVASEDLLEAIAAFLEKRPGRFQGR